MSVTAVVATVDDDRRVRESIHSVLESAGYVAASFESAEQLLESGLLSRVACVIADIRLPGLDGVELQRCIREQVPLMPVIFVTAHDDDAVLDRALRGGAVAFMLKPCDVALLLETVDRVVRMPR